MDEIFTSGDGNALSSPSAGSVALAASDEWWESGTPGFLIRPLLDEQDSGLRTWLMKVAPGAEAPAHSHAELEQVYVIEGEFHDAEAHYRAGDFIARAPGAMHTAGSISGAIVLLVYTRASA